MMVIIQVLVESKLHSSGLRVVMYIMHVVERNLLASPINHPQVTLT